MSADHTQERWAPIPRKSLEARIRRTTTADYEAIVQTALHYLDRLEAAEREAEENDEQWLSRFNSVRNAWAVAKRESQETFDAMMEERARCMAAEAEVARLTAALERVTEHWVSRPWREDKEAHAAWAEDHQAVVEEARAALAASSAEEPQP